MNNNLKYDLIEVSDEEDNTNKENVVEESYSSNSSEDNEESEMEEEYNEEDEEDDEDDYNIILIQKDKVIVDDSRIMEFINFCIDNRYFDDTFYDYGNEWSIIATKLPDTFEKFSSDEDNVSKEKFITTVRDELLFKGDIEFIWESIEKENSASITWFEFIEFFLPFVRYTTV